MANMLDVPVYSGCFTFLIPRFMKFILGMVERLEDRSEPLHILIDKFSQTLTKGMVNYFNQEKQTHFQIPAGLKGALGNIAGECYI